MNPLFRLSRLLCHVLGLSAVGLCLVGCATSGPTSVRSDVGPGSPTNAPLSGADARPASDLLRVGDLVTITFSGVADPPVLRHDERIKASGHITLPHIDPVLAAGKTRGELEEAIRASYVPSQYVQLSVHVQAETRVFYVDGMVKAPGRYPYLGQMTVLRGIAAAGDFNDFARKKRVEVTRANGKKIVVNCIEAQRHPEKDPPLYPDDRIYVPRRYF